MVPMRVQTKAKDARGREAFWKVETPRAWPILMTTWNTPMMKPISSMEAPAVNWADWLE